MSGLSIGKAIKSILSGIEKVYPLVADEGTTFPFVVYKRSNLIPSSTKDRYNYKESATVEIIAASDSYPDSINLAEQIKDKMEHTRGIFNGINIGGVTLISADEDYIEDTFIQKMNFNIEII